MADGTDVGEVAARPRKPWTRRPAVPLDQLPAGTLLSGLQARQYLPYPVSGAVFAARARRQSPFAPPFELDARGRRVYRVSEVQAFILRTPLARERNPDRKIAGEQVPDVPLASLPGNTLIGMVGAAHFLGISRGAVWRRFRNKVFPCLPWRWVAGHWRIRADELRLAMTVMRSRSEQGKVAARTRAANRAAAQALREAPR